MKSQADGSSEVPLFLSLLLEVYSSWQTNVVLCKWVCLWRDKSFWRLLLIKFWQFWWKIMPKSILIESHSDKRIIRWKLQLRLKGWFFWLFESEKKLILLLWSLLCGKCLKIKLSNRDRRFKSPRSSLILRKNFQQMYLVKKWLKHSMPSGLF